MSRFLLVSPARARALAPIKPLITVSISRATVPTIEHDAPLRMGPRYRVPPSEVGHRPSSAKTLIGYGPRLRNYNNRSTRCKEFAVSATNWVKSSWGNPPASKKT